MSRSDPFKVGDELIVANYARKPVTKRDVSKPKKTDAKPTVSEAGKSNEETETDSSNGNGSNGEETAPEFEDSSDGDRSEPAAPVVQPQAVGRGRCDVAEPKPAVPNETAPDVIGGSEPAAPVVQPQAVGRGRHDIAEPKPAVPNETALEVVGGSRRDVTSNDDVSKDISLGK